MRHPNCEGDPAECRIMMSDMMTLPRVGMGGRFPPIPEVFDGNGNVIPRSQIKTTEYYFCGTCGRGWSGQPKAGVDEKPIEHLPALIESEHPHDHEDERPHE